MRVIFKVHEPFSGYVLGPYRLCFLVLCHRVCKNGSAFVLRLKIQPVWSGFFCLTILYLFDSFRRSFIYATIGNAGISFVVGGVGWWIPKFTYYCEKTLSDDPDSITPGQVSYKFGVVTFVAGVTGVWLGAEIARRWRRHNMRADALVCAIGLILSAPVFFVSLYIADKIMILCWVSDN